MSDELSHASRAKRAQAAARWACAIRFRTRVSPTRCHADWLDNPRYRYARPAQRAALQLPPRRAAQTASKKARSRAPKAVSCKRLLGGGCASWLTDAVFQAHRPV